MKQLRQFILLVLMIVALVATRATTSAQEQENWSPPLRLSTGQGKATEASLVVDHYGYVHAFWSEEQDDQTLILHAQFDGQNWSIPNDIMVISTIGAMAVALDNDDIMHLVWSEGMNSLIHYSQASLSDINSATSWQKPYRFQIQGDELALRTDSKGILHLFFTNQSPQRSGIYYTYSTDQGLTWANRVWLDPDIPVDLAPSSLQFVIDDVDQLHAVWAYKSVDSGGGDWVRYIRSVDGGHNWSTPFTIAKNDLGDDTLGAFARPIMIVQEQTVHIIWAGGEQLYRHHRFSTDAGETWSQTTRVFGYLNGQAGDGMAVDNAGHVHYFGQIRFPQGIYHCIWDGEQWSEPVLIYLLRKNSGESFGNNVEAHRTFPIIRTGNQIILTFTDGPTDPNRRLFAMHYILKDITPLAVRATPTPTAIITPESTPEPIPASTISAPSFSGDTVVPSSGPVTPILMIWLGSIPPLLLTGIILVFQLIFRHKR